MPRIDELRGAVRPLGNQKIPVLWHGGVGARLLASLEGADHMEWR